MEVCEVDGRDAYGWLKAAIAYCEYRAGISWRRWRDRGAEHPPDYADAIRILNFALTAPDREPMGLALPFLDAAPSPSPEAMQLSELPRPVLVAELMGLRPGVYRRNTLMGFTRAKLARLVEDARKGRAAARRADRRRA